MHHTFYLFFVHFFSLRLSSLLLLFFPSFSLLLLFSSSSLLPFFFFSSSPLLPFFFSSSPLLPFFFSSSLLLFTSTFYYLLLFMFLGLFVGNLFPSFLFSLVTSSLQELYIKVFTSPLMIRTSLLSLSFSSHFISISFITCSVSLLLLSFSSHFYLRSYPSFSNFTPVSLSFSLFPHSSISSSSNYSFNYVINVINES